MWIKRGLAAAAGISVFVVIFAIIYSDNGEYKMAESEWFEWENAEEVATGDAYVGPWRMNDSEFHLVDDPAVSINDEGVIAVAWANQEKQNIFMQIYEPNGVERFNEPVNVSNNPGVFSWLPRIIISSGDPEHVYALWQEIVFSGGSHGGEIFFAKSTDGGKTFDEPVNLSNTEAGAGKGRFTVRRWFNGSLDLVKSKNGTLFAAWTEYEGALWISRSDDGGETFSEPMHIDGGDETPARAPSIATSPEGRVYLAWSAGEGHNADIRYAMSDNNGSDFGEIKHIEGNGHADAPRIAADKNGAVHLVYSESPRGLWSSYHILYARSNDGQTFDEPVQISSDHSGQIQSSAYSSLKLDENGRIYVLWELFPELGRRPHGLGITVSDDGGETFYSPEVVSGSVDSGLGFNGSQQGLLMNKLDVNRHGTIAVVNSTFNRDVSSHIWMFRGRFKN